MKIRTNKKIVSTAISLIMFMIISANGLAFNHDLKSEWKGPANDFRHGVLKVSHSGRYLEWSDGTPFLYLGDTAWELLSRLNTDEAEEYLENRRQKGFTAIQTVILDEVDGLDTCSCGTSKLIDKDIYKPNPIYFAHIDSILSIAERKGLFLALLPTWGDKVYKRDETGKAFFNKKNAYDYGKWLGEKYHERQNIIWVLGGDCPADDESKDVWDEMAKGILSADSTHLMTFHPYGEHSSSLWFQDSEWLDFNMFQSGHWRKDYEIYRHLLLPDLSKKPIKPVMDGEPRYENIPFRQNPENQRFKASDVRHALYQSMLSGACGHTYGCNEIWQMYDDGRDAIVGATLPWRIAMNCEGASDMIFFRDIWDRFDFRTGAPCQEVFGNNTFPDDNYPVAFGNSEWLIIYLPKGGEITVDIKGKLLHKIFWVNPRTGKVTGAQKIKGTELNLSPKNEISEDWVVILK